MSNTDKAIFHCVVVSGKGGVGKTSITASLACLINNEKIPLIVADTDVDAPNLAILFNTKGNLVEEFSVKTTEKAKFMEEECIQCRLCIDDNFCNFNALSWDSLKNYPVVDSIACEGCRACSLLCPQQAFEIFAVDSGNISELNSEDNFSIITGETILGAQTSGKLVTEMKKYAEKKAKDRNREFMLIDGPPGIGCPVIAAIADCQYAIVVIEPTSAALHDAKRVMNVIHNFQIPFGVIINKSNMWKKSREEIIKFLNEKSIELLGEIPLDKDWPYAISKGLPIIKYSPHGEVARNLSNINKKLLKKFEKFRK